MIRYRTAAVDYHRIFYREAGDPQHSTSTEPPLRLQLGTDSLARVEAKLGEVASEMAAWRTLAESTDYEQTGRRYRQLIENWDQPAPPGAPKLQRLLIKQNRGTYTMSSEKEKAVVRRNTEEVQSRGNFDVFEELFAVDFVDHTPQPNCTPDRDGARSLYRTLRAAFPDFRADIHWQAADGELVTTYKTYHGTHQGTFLGLAPTGRRIHFETVDVMRVRNGKITEHWGVANLFSLMQQLGAWPTATQA